MPDNENLKQEKKIKDSDKKIDRDVADMDKNEGQTQNGTTGGTGSDVENYANVDKTEE